MDYSVIDIRRLFFALPQSFSHSVVVTPGKVWQTCSMDYSVINTAGCCSLSFTTFLLDIVHDG